MLQTDADLKTLIQQGDHLQVLRFLRVHQLRKPSVTLEHAQALLGPDLDQTNNTRIDALSRLAILEQVCLAAVDNQQPDLANLALLRLKELSPESSATAAPGTKSSTMKDSARFRCLLGRCLEATEDYEGAKRLYNDLLKENPANLMALKRLYCVLRAQQQQQQSKEETTDSSPSITSEMVMEALNNYLQQNYSDIAGWYELAHYRLDALGDYKGAAYALEEVLLSVPSDTKIHVELAECYATVGGTDNLLLARKHFAQALELNSTSKRAQFGLIASANAYLCEMEASNKKTKEDVQAEHEMAVAHELIKYGAEQVLKSYKGSKLYPAVQALMKEYTEA